MREALAGITGQAGEVEVGAEVALMTTLPRLILTIDRPRSHLLGRPRQDMAKQGTADRGDQASGLGQGQARRQVMLWAAEVAVRVADAYLAEVLIRTQEGCSVGAGTTEGKEAQGPVQDLHIHLLDMKAQGLGLQVDDD